MKRFSAIGLSVLLSFMAFGANAQFITIRQDAANQKVDVWCGDELFTSYCYNPYYWRPSFYPVNAPGHLTVTRGWPWQPRPHEHADHPHQYGLTFIYGDVNGFDFWNGSWARTAQELYRYGKIKTARISDIANGDGNARMVVQTEWFDAGNNLLLLEEVTYLFGCRGDMRWIERHTVLTAVHEKVTFGDNKEGLWFIRLDKAFEEPAAAPELHTDALGYTMTEKTIWNEGAQGMIRNDRGDEKEAGTFSKPTRWLSNSTVKNGEKVTIVLMDHPKNPGYPARAFSRGYGMMALNNIGTRCYTPSAEPTQLVLEKGASVTFRHKFVVVSGRDLPRNEIEKIFDDFHPALVAYQ
ncbi:MAG: PmoA family protein [Rikenellaceae bacterium]|jgi:hypothetical protein|nr:PmoA family protein [Rikenellaceae bacterium]